MNLQRFPSTNSTLAHYPAHICRVHAHCPDARENQPPYPYKMTTQDMLQRYRKFKRGWEMYYAYNNLTGNSVSLKTRVKPEADKKVNAMNETERQPGISLGLARVYLNATDPKLATRIWQDVMENIVAKKTDETRRRWETAIKDHNFDCIRRLHVCETRPEHFDRALADGKVSRSEERRVGKE